MIRWTDKHKKVLDQAQLSLAPILEEFCNTHILVGGTAIALQLGHRKSIDFDFFSFGEQGTGVQLYQRIQSCGFQLDKDRRNTKFWLTKKQMPEVTFFINGVKIQLLDFSRNPMGVDISLTSNKTIADSVKTLSLDRLGALKLYAVMYRKKRKDIVDLYYIMHQNKYKLANLIEIGEQIFKVCFDKKAILEELQIDNWDSTEKVNWIGADHPSHSEVVDYFGTKVEDYIRYDL